MSLPHFELTELIKTIGYVGIFFMVFAESGLFFGFFFPGDSLLFTAGFLASQNLLDIRILVPPEEVSETKSSTVIITGAMTS